MFKTGTILPLVMLIAILFTSIQSMIRQRRGDQIHIRRIAAIDAIEEAVGRATEIDKPVHFMPGGKTLSSEEAPQILAGLACLRYIAKLTARKGAGLIVTVKEPSSLPLIEEIVRESYLEEGHAEDFRSDMIVHPSRQGYRSGVMGILTREKVAANIMIGPMYSDTLLLLESAFRVNAMQIGGTGTKTMQIPVMIAICDYVMIGEEIYAAGAYLSREPDMIASLLTSDIIKTGMLGLLIITTLVTLFSNVLLDFLKM